MTPNAKKAANNLTDLVKERNLTLLHVIMASFMGQLADLGLLNQGSANLIGLGVGQRLGRYFKEVGILLPENDVEAVKRILELADVAESLSVEKLSDENLLVGIKSDKCKYCPKGIGGAEISGTVCPIPYLIVSTLTSYTGKKYSIALWKKDKSSIVIKKEEGYCKFMIQKT
nr:hypothetical protein [Candidatus Baldrarchaeota archaeon]